MNIKVLVASHKIYKMPDDEMYIPVFVGAMINADKKENREQLKKSGFIRDDSGCNISWKNPLYCELTALYWGWKNQEADYLGLVHYRRHFMRKKGRFSWDKVLTNDAASEIFNKGYDVIIPQKRRYVIDTIYSHYANSHHEEDLIATADVINQFFPEYAEEFVDVLKRRSAHMFNMCIMKRSILNDYCQWLFDVLEKVEKVLDISGYSDFDKRVFGRISELLLDVWLYHNNVSFFELNVRNTEGEHYFNKVFNVIKRKLIKRN